MHVYDVILHVPFPRKGYVATESGRTSSFDDYGTLNMVCSSSTTTSVCINWMQLNYKRNSMRPNVIIFIQIFFFFFCSLIRLLDLIEWNASKNLHNDNSRSRKRHDVPSLMLEEMYCVYRPYVFKWIAFGHSISIWRKYISKP